MNSKVYLMASMSLALTFAGAATPVFAQATTAPFDATEQPKLRHQRNAMPSQYIVKFRDSISKAEIRKIAQELGSRNRPTLHLYKQALNGFAIRLSEQEALELSQDDRVEYVEEDALLSVNQVTMVPCGIPASDGHMPKCVSQTTPSANIDRLDQTSSTLSNSYFQAGTGKNVNVYVMDTGILTTHTDFQGRATSVYDAIKDGNGSIDCNGHGTFAAGLIGGYIYGVAKEANLRSVRVLDCNGSGSTSNIIAGIDWISANAPRPSIVNMSFGGAGNSSLDTAVENAVKLGYIYVVAAGNDNVDASTVSPARVSSAFTVGSRDSQGNRASFSNYGSLVDAYLPGIDLYSAANTSTTGQAIGSGTSFSAPLVAGTLAVALEWYPNAKTAPSTVAFYLSMISLGKTVSAPTSLTAEIIPSLQVITNIGRLKNFGIPYIYLP
jgi:subtilisin family serine protease